MPRVNTQTISSEAREVISNIIKVVDLENENNRLEVPLTSKTKRAALYAGVSISSIKRIRKEDQERQQIIPGTKLKTPGKRNKKKGIVEKYDDWDFRRIRETIEDFYLIQKKIPTIQELLESVRTKMEFKHGRVSFYRLLKYKGFVWKKFGKNIKILMELPEIVNERYKYLSALKNYKEDQRPIIYIDKTLVKEKDPFVVLHAGCPEIGFLKDVELLFKPIEHCQSLISIEILEKWIKERLLPKLPERSVVVIYDCPYFSEVKTPDKYSTKQYIETWLDQNNITYSPCRRKSELLNLVNLFLSKPKPSLNNLLQSQGHSLLKIPTFLSELNPIELAWKDFKASLQGNFISKYLDLLPQISQALETVCVEKWRGYGKYTETLEDLFWRNDEKMEIVLDEIIGNLDKSCEKMEMDSDVEDSYDEEEDS